MDKNNIWIITPITNLHVGNENASTYGLIDLGIQKNPVTDIPCINSSSLKGAIKEYMENLKDVQEEELKKIFGSGKYKNDTKKGKYTFFDAELIALPVADDNNSKGYKLVACKDAIDQFVSKAKMLGIFDVTTEEIIEKINADNKAKMMSEFKVLCDDDHLPIIARNFLENGKSTNLWYEQVLPPQSVLITIIDNDSDSILTDKIQENSIIQIGANATIGYGYCTFTHL